MNFHSAGEATRRKEEILRIVRETTVHSQDEILAALRKHGFKVTQPTLSRDIRDLGLAKTPSGYIVPGEVVAPVVSFTPREVRETRLEHLVRDSVLSAEAAMNLVVIKTPAAAAQPLASAIDLGDVEDVLGTVGGDDTIFVAFRSPNAAAGFARRLQQLTGLSPERRRTRA
ncbi:MAG TPA: arginine repressor [Thermoanaerobaculia bacterium]|nr:arginine repressor [Thermoanaerobaculia bacterium]